MNIILKRIRYRPETIDGQIWIDGEKVCSSAENNKLALAPGTYPITLVKCRQHARKMPVIQVHGCSLCTECKKLPYVGNNTTMPMICPMLKPGNGVYNRTDGSIIVGKYICPGCLSHPKQAFDALYQRIRKNLERGNEVTLTIRAVSPT